MRSLHAEDNKQKQYAEAATCGSSMRSLHEKGNKQNQHAEPATYGSSMRSRMKRVTSKRSMPHSMRGNFETDASEN